MFKLTSFIVIFLVGLAASLDDFNCPEEGQHMYPHPTRCAKFLECNKGLLVEHDCFPSTVWNADLGFCDFEENVDCVDVEEPEEEDIGSGSGSGDEPGPVGECPLINHNDYVDFLTHSHDCTIYYMCDWGTPIQMTCPDGLHFNPTLNVCDYPWDAGCTAEGF
nr:peritrophin-1-like [Onthophagus taurus]